MGGGVRSKNPTGCCPKNVSSSCKPQQCGDRGNIFTGFKCNPYAEFNFFADPFAAYQVPKYLIVILCQFVLQKIYFLMIILTFTGYPFWNSSYNCSPGCNKHNSHNSKLLRGI